MTGSSPRRMGVIFGIVGSMVHLGCSDDDTPPLIILDNDAGSTSSQDAAPSGPASSSTSSKADAGGIDAGATASSSSSEIELTSVSDAGGDSVETPDADAGQVSNVGLLEALSEDPDTTTFAQLIVRAEMQEDLDKEGPFTVLAPINSGFERLPEGYLDSLTRKQVETLVRNHLLSEPQSSAELVSAGSVVSILELTHDVSQSDGEIYINGLTRVTAPDTSLRTDTVHKVDSVLTVEVFPGTLAEAVHAYPRLSELESHLTDSDRALLGEDDKTLFAPINGGFEDFVDEAASAPTDAGVTLSALSYHVLPHKESSSALSFGGVTETALGAYLGVSSSSGLAIHDGQRLSRVVIADLPVQSGELGSVLHVVEDALVAPPTVDEVLAGSIGGQTFATLRARLSEANVPDATGTFLDHLATSEAVTVFAPSDAAFNRITGSFGVNLGKVLGFHVMDAVVDSRRLAEPGDLGLPTTLTDSAVDTFGIVARSGTADTVLLLDGLATVVVRDIPAANGVVHVIDGVLVPQDVTFPGTTGQALAAYPALSKVSDAVTQTGLLGGVTSTLFAPFDLAFGEITSASSFVEAHALSPGVRDRLTFGTQVFTTLAGSSIDIDAETSMIGDVQIVRPDLLTQSGVVHIIDSQLEMVNDESPDAGD